MSLFLSWKRMVRPHALLGFVVGWAMVSMVFVALFAAGCKKKSPGEGTAPLESVITNRMSDPAYVDALRANRKQQTQKAGERHAVVVKMEACIARVKATLPKDIDDATLKAALEKDEEWRALEAQNAKAIGAITQVLDEARSTVRRRMLEEARAVQAVKEGKAKVAEPKAVK